MVERGTRRITEPQVLRALAHPTRMSIIEILGMGPATATRCAELTGESVASCSYHLGMLAKYGFVGPADGGDGREKPWLLLERSQSWNNADNPDVESQLAAETLSGVHVDHAASQYKDALRRLSREPAQWRSSTGSAAGLMYLTADETTALQHELIGIARRFAERAEDPTLRPEGSRPVRVYLANWLALPADKEQ